MKKQVLVLSMIIGAISGMGQDRKMDFPNVNGYLTLTCDFHIHTVFSDGSVWPDIRVQEAVKDGLDAISLTEHIEYQPHGEDIPHPDRNRSFEIAKENAKVHDLLVIHGAEITRGMPPGHANAIFITDANKLNVDDAKEAYQAAVDQGAFIFWNHPNWYQQTASGIPVLSDFHKDLVQSGLLHGIEVVNDLTFSETAVKICQDNDLTIMGTSDIHGLVDWQYMVPEGGHRPVCLVLATEKTEAAIKDAMFAKRTITWFRDILAGDPEPMGLLLDSCLTFKNEGFIGASNVLQVEVDNTSDARFFLNNRSDALFHDQTDLIEIMPQSTTTLQILDIAEGETPSLEFEVMNAVVGFKKKAVIRPLIVE